MKIINNRYKIDKNIYNDFFIETYRVQDLWMNNDLKFLKIHHYNLQKQMVDYLIRNQIKIRNIKHRNILHSEKIDIVETINMEEINSLMYYSISENIEYTSVFEKIHLLTFRERLNILLEIILAINFLHFRGFKYICLNPLQVAILHDGTVKLQNIPSIVEKVHNDEYSEFERRFLSPDFIFKSKEKTKNLDYYSLARMIEYLFLEDMEVLDSLNGKYNKDDILKFFKHIIEDLENRDLKTKDFNLIKLVDEISHFFHMDYKYDLIEERDQLFLEGKIVGRDREILKIIEFDNGISEQKSHSNLVIIRGESGSGKTRFLKEIKYRLRLRKRRIYSVDIKEKSEDDIIYLADLLRQAMNHTNKNLRDKYRKEFSKILPELSLNINEDEKLDLKDNLKKYRIYNRIANYLKELSENQSIYLFLDNIENLSEDLFKLLKYLFDNLISSNIIFVISFNQDKIQENKNIKLSIESFKDELNILQISLNKLNLQETGEMIKNILGMAYINLDFAAILFKESNGNPKKIGDLLVYLYNNKKLYMKKNGRWALDINDFSEIYIPTSIDDHSLDYLSKIKDTYYELIKTMSIFTGLIGKPILSEIFPTEEDLDLLLEELVRKNLIEEKLVEGIYNYRLRNIDLKKYLYLEIEEDKKIDLHKKAASIIEKTQAYLSESLIDELIYHLINSMQKSKALEIIMNKVDGLENKNGIQANNLLEKAYNILTESTENTIKIKIMEKLLYIRLLKDELKEDDSKLEEYIALAKTINSKYHTLNAKRFKAEIHFQGSRRELFIREIEEIESINKEEPLEEFQLYCLTFRANLDIGLGEFQKAKEKLEEALSMALEWQLSHQLGNIYNMLGIVEYLSGNQKQAIDYYESSYKYFIADRDIVRSVKPINNLGNIYVSYYNDPTKAIEHYKKGLDISRKYGLKKMQMIFSVNLSEVNKLNYKYDKALEYILQANELAIEIQDSVKIAICQNLLGNIYLEKEEYHKAYDCYTYVTSIYRNDKIKDREFCLSYYEFLGNFYFSLGLWEESLKYTNMAKKLYIDFDIAEYYKFKFRLILIEIVKNNKIDKNKLDSFIEEYKLKAYAKDFRKAVLLVAILSIKLDDRAYANKYLQYDTEIKHRAENEFLDNFRRLVIFAVELNKDNLEESIVQLEKAFSDEFYLYKTMLIEKIASIFERQNNYKQAIKYYVEVLESIHKNAIRIPSKGLKLAYINSRNIHKIKENLDNILENYLVSKIDQIRIDHIGMDEDFPALNDYFDLTNIIDAIGKEEFSQIININSYGQALGIKNIESLISNFKEDYKYNLDLILNYLSKEALATDAFIIEYNKEDEVYEIISSLNSEKNINKNINDGILKLATRTDKGLLLRKNLDKSMEKIYNKLLSKDISGVICVPININGLPSKSKGERRSKENSFEYISTYVYLETDRVFNNFSEDMLNVINSTLYLIYLNIEMNKLRIMGTIDKLTGASTRKYYDEQFSELIESKSFKGDKFSVLMIDLDKFKAVNDTYGHRKGDQVLRQLGATIRSNIRSTDIFGRYGGEEFVLVLKDTDEKKALIIGEKIRKNVEESKIEGIKNSITVSIGISLYPNHSKFKEDLVEKADQALYYAKESGRNKVCLWDQKMDNDFERVDKLAGILTATNDLDNKNILGLVEIINLIGEDTDLEDKVYKYLGELLNVIDSESASIIILDKNEKEYYTRVRFDDKFAHRPILNQVIIDRVVKNKKGEFLIDWDNTDDIDPISGVPNWKSLIILPMIKNGQVKAVTYLSTDLKQNEFDFNSFNLAKNYAGIFTSLL